MPKKVDRLSDKNPFHHAHAGKRELQARIIFHKLRAELLGNKKIAALTLSEMALMNSAAVLTLELKALEDDYLKTRKRMPKGYLSTANALRSTLNQLSALNKNGKPGKGTDSCGLAGIINGESA